MSEFVGAPEKQKQQGEDEDSHGWFPSLSMGAARTSMSLHEVKERKDRAAKDHQSHDPNRQCNRAEHNAGSRHATPGEAGSGAYVFLGGEAEGQRQHAEQ